MQWQRLDKDNSEHVINSVKSDANAGMFSLGTSEVKRARTVFYKDYFIYKVTNFASLPSFSFQYLSDGKFFSYLDGTETPIYSVNDKAAFNLTESSVMAYLAFFFSHITYEDMEVMIIQNPHDMPLLDSMGPALYDAVFNNHTPATVTKRDDGGFHVEADLYMDTQLIRAHIEVTPRGRVAITKQDMIKQSVMTTESSEIMM